jgi:BlaI family penicillinase repressor
MTKPKKHTESDQEPSKMENPAAKTDAENQTAASGARITQAEWEVMRVLWDAEGLLSASQVTAQLAVKSRWNPKTVRTFLNRLVQKKAVAAITPGPNGSALLHYAPLIDEVSLLRAKQETFLGRFLGGTIQAMLAGCIQSGEIPVDELIQLREVIDRQVSEQEGESP